MNPPPTPDNILQTGFAFWNSKVLLIAVEFGLLTTPASAASLAPN
jgi:hypothetical protein